MQKKTNSLILLETVFSDTMTHQQHGDHSYSRSSIPQSISTTYSSLPQTYVSHNGAYPSYEEEEIQSSPKHAYYTRQETHQHEEPQSYQQQIDPSEYKQVESYANNCASTNDTACCKNCGKIHQKKEHHNHAHNHNHAGHHHHNHAHAHNHAHNHNHTGHQHQHKAHQHAHNHQHQHQAQPNPHHHHHHQHQHHNHNTNPVAANFNLGLNNNFVKPFMTNNLPYAQFAPVF